MAGTNVPVWRSVRAAADFTRFSLPRVSGVLAAALLVNIVSLLAAASPAAMLAARVATTLLEVIAYGALFRLAFADEHPSDPVYQIGPYGFQWRKVETRLLGALLMVTFLAVLAILFWFVLAVCFGATAMVSGNENMVSPGPPANPVQAAFALVTLIFLMVGLWVGVRICLFSAATVAEGRIMVFSTWGLTKGQFWRIFFATLFVLSPAIALAFVLKFADLPLVVSRSLFVLFSVVNSFCVLPGLCGLYAYLYRGLRPTRLAGASASI